MTSVQAYNITIGEQSAVYEYNPHRDIDLATGWNDSYTGSAIYVYGGLGTGTPYRATQYSGANAILTFQGTAVYMCFTPGSNVEWSFSLNPTAAYRQLDGSADPTCSQWGGTTLVVADSLTYNSYTATLTVNSIPPGGQFAFFGSVVSVSIGPVGTKANPPLTIDDHASTWTYTPVNEWDQETDTGAVDGEYSQTCYYNGQNIASASYTATNTSALYVVGMLRADIAFYTVQLNGEPPLKYNAFNFWTTNQQVLFFAGGLDPTQEYTVQLQNYDTDYTTPPIPANCLRIDAIYLINGSPPPGTSSTSSLPPSSSTSAPTSASSGSSLPTTDSSNLGSGSSSSTPTGAIVGGVVGGLAVIGILIVALVLLLRRRNRAEAAAPVAWKPDGDLTLPGLGPDTVPIPYFNDSAQLPVQRSNDRAPMSQYGDSSVMGTSIRTPTPPPPNWLGREKSPAATYNFGRNAGVLATPFIPPSNNFIASSSAGSPSVASPSVIGDSIQHSSPDPGTTHNAASPELPVQSEGYLSELPTYESLRGERRPSI